MLKEDKLYAERLFTFRTIDTQLDFTVPQFAAFIERIHPFDAAQRPRRGRPPRSG